MTSKSFQGARTFDGVVVTVNQQPLDPRRDLKRFSDNHFEWGYEGDESRQLALAIIADCVDDDTALRHVEDFMREIVANFSNEWEMNDDNVSRALNELSK